jgi:hypothetical protein
MTNDTKSVLVHMSANPIRYHTNDVRSLMKNTIAGLEGNGVNAPGVGERRDGKFILRGGAYLSSATRAILSVHMGGDALAVPATLDPRTVRFMDSANAMSPAGFKGRAAGAHAVHTREPWRDLSGDMDEERSDASTGRIRPPLAGNCREEPLARKRGGWDVAPTVTLTAIPKPGSTSAEELLARKRGGEWDFASTITPGAIPRPRSASAAEHPPCSPALGRHDRWGRCTHSCLPAWECS